MSRNIEDLEPETRVKCQALIDWCFIHKCPILLTSTKRTHQEQHQLYLQGRGLPGKIVTMADSYQSWHETARAFDVAFRRGKNGATWQGPWEVVASYAETLGLEWGGKFTSLGDRDHFQFTNGLTLAYAINLEDQRTA